jgi:hypothetical protein
MDFISQIQLSHNGRYIIYENIIYDVHTDKSFDIHTTDLNFWLTFLKENSEQSYKNLLTKYIDIQKIIRETVYNVSNFFTSTDKDKFLLEFETKFSNNLITEDSNQESNIDKINSSWDFIIEKVNTQFELLKEDGLFSKIGEKISSGFNWLKEKGIGWFFEQLRTALQSWGGAAVQTFLATFGAAVGGNVILVIVWGTMLAYDIYRGIQGEWDWANLLIDIIAVITTGPGAKIIGGLFSKLGIMGKNLPLGKIIQKISTSKLGLWFANLIKKVASKISSITELIGKGVSWLSTKLGIKNLSKVTSNITSKVSSIVDEISTATSKVIKPKISNVAQKSNVLKQGLKSAGSGVKKIASTKGGQIATSAGLTYGVNKATGSSNEVLGGAFIDKEQQMADLLSNDNFEIDINQLP